MYKNIIIFSMKSWLYLLDQKWDTARQRIIGQCMDFFCDIIYQIAPKREMPCRGLGALNIELFELQYT
ncbi:hypothetical protein AYI69_g7167 [Smittium culicis]|uniref:Uncharacterized protein n=1 Tax=Smittium culicis TaxID=133412 RepID=A0A1R1XU27_9FUNG|nr:hypothetical protein AYI69_g7167 [Smittium culicis]